MFLIVVGGLPDGAGRAQIRQEIQHDRQAGVRERPPGGRDRRGEHRQQPLHGLYAQGLRGYAERAGRGGDQPHEFSLDKVYVK